MRSMVVGSRPFFTSLCFVFLSCYLIVFPYPAIPPPVGPSGDRPSLWFFFFWCMAPLVGGYSSSVVGDTPPPLSILLFPFFFAAVPSPMSRVVARPPPVSFFGPWRSRLVAVPPRWWLPLPTPVACAHYAHVMHSSRVADAPSSFFFAPHCVYIFFCRISSDCRYSFYFIA